METVAKLVVVFISTSSALYRIFFEILSVHICFKVAFTLGFYSRISLSLGAVCLLFICSKFFRLACGRQKTSMISKKAFSCTSHCVCLNTRVVLF